MSEEQQQQPQENNNNNQQQQKPDFTEFEKLQQQNTQPASLTQPVQYDQQGNAVFPQQDNLGNPNKSRGIIGGGNQQQQSQVPESNYDRPKWDKVNPPTVFQADQQVQKIQNPTSPQELEQLIKQQQDQTSKNLEASQEREKALKLKIQGQLHSYVPPEHLKDHPYLAGFVNQTPAAQQGQPQTTQQKLDAGEEVISITDQPQPTQQQQDQTQPIQPSQIKNGIENLVTEQQSQEEQQQGTS
jgi:hypothetical protein